MKSFRSAFLQLSVISIVFSVCTPDSAYICPGCAQDYFLFSSGSQVCVGECPEGYIFNSPVCESRTSGLLFDTDFSIPIDLSLSTIGDFQTLGADFKSVNSPRLTKDRGVYFLSGESLQLNFNPVPSPQLSILIWTRVITSGVIFEVVGNNPYLRLEYDLINEFSLSLKYCNDLNTCAIYFCMSTGINISVRRQILSGSTWSYLVVTTDQQLSNMIDFNIQVNYQDTLQSIYGINTIGIDLETYYWYIGMSGSGFEGFVYHASGYNSISFSNLPFVNPPYCDPNQYFLEGECNNCDITPSIPALWCVRPSDPSICYSSNCLSCTGYSSSLCTSTTCPSNCMKCIDSSTCSVCDTNYMLISYTYWGIYCFSSFKVHLLSNLVPTLVTSGSDPNTFFQNSPDPDDPIGYTCRGYFFDGTGMYLTPTVSVVFPTNLVIYMWVKPISGNIVTKGNSFQINSSLSATFSLSDSFGNTAALGSRSLSNSDWIYMAFQLSYIDFYTTLTSYNDIDLVDTVSIEGYYYQDHLDNIFIIGASDFQGFLASLGVLSTDANGGFSVYEQKDLNFYCGAFLNPCELYPVVTDSCAETCIDCDSCYDSHFGTCFACNSGTDSDQNYCGNGCTDTAFYQYACYDIRGDCFSKALGLACSSCLSPFYLFYNVCVEMCPSSMTTDLANLQCIWLGTEIFVLELSNKIVISEENDFDFGSDSKSEYPNFDASDPVPALNRGYHFTSNSYISSSKYFLAPNLSVALWVKLDQDSGVNDIFAKQLNQNDFLVLTRNIKTYFTIHTGITNYYLEDSNPITLTNWVYIQIMIYFDEIFLTSTLTLFYNTGQSSEKTISFDFWSDKPASLLIIGSNKGYGLSGFIYSIQAYSSAFKITDKYSTSCIASTPCPSSSIDLGLCTINQLETSCTACNSTCIYGCVRAEDCKLCADPLCQSCSSFDGSCLNCLNDATIVGSLCQCNDGFFKNNYNYCEPCDGLCETCNGGLVSNCVTCKTYTFFTRISRCMPAAMCPTRPGIFASMIPATNSCVLESGMVFYRVFDSLQDSFYDDVSGIQVTTGADSSFYPDYAASDPIVASGRGYYFSSSAFLQIDPGTSSKLVFGPEFSIGLWVNINQPGILLARSSSTGIVFQMNTTTYYYAYVATINGGGTYNSPRNYNYGQWCLLILKIGSRDYGNILRTTVNAGSTNNIDIDYFQDSIDNVVTMIGNNAGNGFSGFVWSIVIYNIWHGFSVSSSNGVAYPIELTGVLPLCTNSQYPPDCLPCLPNCLYSCNKAINCYLCNDPYCSTCTEIDICTGCIDYAIMVGGACQCINGFNSITNACNLVIDCYRTCKTCSDASASGCLTCMDGYYSALGFCIRCPSGYTNTTGDCVLISDIAFVVTFDTLKGVFYDRYGLVPIITGNSQGFYPDYDSEDPIATFLQGFYFNGISSVLRLPQFGNFDGPELVLGPIWTFEIWIMPASPAGCLTSSTSAEGLLFSFCFTESTFDLALTLIETPTSYISFPFATSANTWQVIRIILNYIEASHIYIYSNSILYGSRTLPGKIFPNYFLTTTYAIGLFENNHYKGFIYEITLYTSLQVPTRSLQLANCEVAYKGTCLSTCPINQYWVGPDYYNCLSCLENCQSCRRNDTCNLCQDVLCKECNDFSEGTCNSCISNAQDSSQCGCVSGTVLDFMSFQCVVCGTSQYYNNVTCVDCPVLCNTCDAAQCFTCIEHAILVNPLCECSIGRNGSDCSPAYFSASLLLNSDNTILIVFSDPVLMNLKTSDISIFTNLSSSQLFTISQWSPTRHYVVLEISDTIPNDCWAIITFLHPSQIVSTSNSILLTKSLSILLYSTESLSNDITKTSEAESTSKTVAVTITTTSVSLALVNPNPACLWSFINTVQMLCFIGMSSIQLPPRFKGYLKGLKKYNMFPNVFIYFTPHTGGEKPFEKAYEFGYTDNLILFNSGNYISAFLFMLVIWFLVFLLSKLTHIKPFSIEFIKKKIANTLNNYKYGTFIRFWITCYLEVFAAGIIVFLTTTNFMWAAILNYIAGILIIATVLITPILFFYYSYKNKNKIKVDEEINANWGTLFNEFNNDKGLGSSMFYFVFFTRRILYLLIQFFLQDWPIIQLTLNIVLSVSNFTYLVVFRPFSEPLLNVSNPLSEAGILLIFSLASVNLMDIPSDYHDVIDQMLVGILNAIMGIQMATSVIVFFRTVYLIVRKKCQKKVVPIEWTATTKVSKISEILENQTITKE